MNNVKSGPRYRVLPTPCADDGGFRVWDEKETRVAFADEDASKACVVARALNGCADRATAVTASGATVTDLQFEPMPGSKAGGHYSGMLNRGGGMHVRSFWAPDGSPAAYAQLVTLDDEADRLVIVGAEPMQPGDQVFTVERQYLAPVYQHVIVAARDAEAAMRAAMDEDRFDWDRATVDHENARPHYVTGCWAGDEAYQGDALGVPAELSPPVDVAGLRALILAKRADWAARQVPAGQDNDGDEQEEADTVVDVLDEILLALPADA